LVTQTETGVVSSFRTDMEYSRVSLKQPAQNKGISKQTMAVGFMGDMVIGRREILNSRPRLYIRGAEDEPQKLFVANGSYNRDNPDRSFELFFIKDLP
jgi:hypothetical protein